VKRRTNVLIRHRLCDMGLGGGLPKFAGSSAPPTAPTASTSPLIFRLHRRRFRAWYRLARARRCCRARALKVAGAESWAPCAGPAPRGVEVSAPLRIQSDMTSTDGYRVIWPNVMGQLVGERPKAATRRRRNVPGCTIHCNMAVESRSGDRAMHEVEQTKCLACSPAGVEAGARTPHRPCVSAVHLEVGEIFTCVDRRACASTFAAARAGPGWMARKLQDRPRAPARPLPGLLLAAFMRPRAGSRPYAPPGCDRPNGRRSISRPLRAWRILFWFDYSLSPLSCLPSVLQVPTSFPRALTPCT